jgi:glycosyltransferase involved in cell wall biosynthesis
MRIGIDIKVLRHNRAGIGRYLRSILDVLQIIDNENDYVLFSPAPVHFEIRNPRWKKVIEKGNIPGPGIIWQQFTLAILAEKENIEVMWGPEQTIFHNKPKDMATVLTVHDFVSHRFPETMKKSVLWVNRLFLKRSLETADRILCVSYFTFRELRNFYPEVPIERVRVTPLGFFGKSKNIEDMPPRENFLFFPGSTEPRKNLKNLLLALEILARKGMKISLYLSGPVGWKNKKFEALLSRSPVKDSVHLLGFVDDDKLSELYRECRSLIFPSVYEGFGLPVLEAIAFGTPVLTSKNSVMEEIAENYASYFDPNSPESIAETIETFWNTPAEESAEKEHLRKKILARYTWENAAREVLQVFRELKREP